MAKFRKKPVVVEAVQLLWNTWSEMCEHAGVGKLSDGKPQGITLPDDKIGLLIPTKEGLVIAREGDWIVKGVACELFACKPDFFAAAYEEVVDG